MSLEIQHYSKLSIWIQDLFTFLFSYFIKKTKSHWLYKSSVTFYKTLIL